LKTNLVERAYDAFCQSRYQIARDLYQEAAKLYGYGMFDFNIRACEQRLANGSESRNPADISPQSIDCIKQQLNDTQLLLEYYYRRCRELEYFARRDD